MVKYKLIIVLTCVIAAPLVFTTVRGGQPEGQTSGSQVRIGVFDSRAVAVAYNRSEAFISWLTGIAAETEKAKAAGDENRIKELELEVQAHQELAHKQVFSTWPVNEILEQIAEKIPVIATQAGVDVIVSKWQITYKNPGVEFVDVTDLMVEPFRPDDDARKVINDIQAMDPVPLEELKKGE
jgi:hypothetical protein